MTLFWSSYFCIGVLVVGWLMFDDLADADEFDCADALDEIDFGRFALAVIGWPIVLLETLFFGED